MTARTVPIAFYFALLLMLSACMSKVKAEESMKKNQVQAQDLIKAINTYHQQRGQLPEQLDVLVPDYLNELPVTIENQEFAYNTVDVADYHLCFYIPRTKNWGCCYIHRLERWDCFLDFGD
jgi:hypothetical protein